jgi:hypothetical protein
MKKFHDPSLPDHPASASGENASSQPAIQLVYSGIMPLTNEPVCRHIFCRERWRPAGVLLEETGRRDAGAPRLFDKAWSFFRVFRVFRG